MKINKYIIIGIVIIVAILFIIFGQSIFGAITLIVGSIAAKRKEKVNTHLENIENINESINNITNQITQEQNKIDSFKGKQNILRDRMNNLKNNLDSMSMDQKIELHKKLIQDNK